MTDQIVVRPATDAERYRATDELVWSAEAQPELETARVLRAIPVEQRFAADLEYDERELHAGVYGVYPLDLAVPARSGARLVHVAGLTYVGVHPDVRRRGVLSAMMRDHLDRCRAAGTSVSVLHASETGIYGRFGYGIASVEQKVSLSSGTTLSAPALDEEAAGLRLETVTANRPESVARLEACERRCALDSPGVVIGSSEFYRFAFDETPSILRGKEPERLLFAVHGGTDVGVAWIRRHPEFTDANPAGRVRASILTGSPVARLAILRRLLELDLMRTVEIGRIGVDDPLHDWLGGPRALGPVTSADNVWVRLVDLPAALEARDYSAPADVVVEVADARLPANAGRWRIRVDDGRVEVRRTEDAAELSLDTRTLASAYLGGANLIAQHRAGLLTEHREGAVAALSAAMRTDLAPTPAMGF